MEKELYEVVDVYGDEIKATEEEIVEMLTDLYVDELKEIIKTEVSIALDEGIQDTAIMADWIEQNF